MHCTGLPQSTVIVGVVGDKAEVSLVCSSLLLASQGGYIENPSMVACGNEPLQLLSVFTALEKSQDAIGITCEDHILQYALSIR